mmetsp:Transcript_15377/g.32389  ORF Transcript_15377/g.32389 Transcript_15377/m.32389 type:complete len:256 (-) Transcript_15377:1954-2721(-)
MHDEALKILGDRLPPVGILELLDGLRAQLQPFFHEILNSMVDSDLRLEDAPPKLGLAHIVDLVIPAKVLDKLHLGLQVCRDEASQAGDRLHVTRHFRQHLLVLAQLGVKQAEYPQEAEHPKDARKADYASLAWRDVTNRGLHDAEYHTGHAQNREEEVEYVGSVFEVLRSLNLQLQGGFKHEDATEADFDGQPNRHVFVGVVPGELLYDHPDAVKEDRQGHGNVEAATAHTFPGPALHVSSRGLCAGSSSSKFMV